MSPFIVIVLGYICMTFSAVSNLPFAVIAAEQCTVRMKGTT